VISFPKRGGRNKSILNNLPYRFERYFIFYKIPKPINLKKHMKTYQQTGNESLLIINHRTSKKILINDVILLEGNVNYTIFHLQSGKEKVVAHSIKFFEPFLETHGFLRVHRSFMINPNYVKEYNQNEEVLTMANGQKANISRRRKHTMKGFGD
jgi:DNA-binding LytR/AlgR family response regulator